jgi:hypothetical protein
LRTPPLFKDLLEELSGLKKAARQAWHKRAAEEERDEGREEKRRKLAEVQAKRGDSRTFWAREMQKAAAKDLKSNSKNTQGKINHLSKVYDRLMKEMKDMAQLGLSQ